MNATETILRLPALIEKTGLQRSTIYALQSIGLLPPSVSIASRAVAWVASEVDAVIAARISGDSDEQIRELVRSLVVARKKSSGR